MKTAAPSPRLGRWVLGVLAALFLSGVVGSFLLIQSGWRPGTTKNYGELLQPARPVNDVVLTDSAGDPVAFSTLKGKWTLVYFGPAACPPRCVDNLYKMRQITAAQGKEAHRVQQVFVVTDAAGMERLQRVLTDYPGTRVLHGAPAAVRALAAQFAVPAGTPLDGLHRVYLVDPLGNFMMSYPAEADPRGMNKDLKLLLRVSQVG